MDFWQVSSDNVELAAKAAINNAARNNPRSLQKAIGPSEVGQPCLRRLAYRMLDVEPASTSHDIWRPTVGTAAHAWLADALLAANADIGTERWLVEQRVEIADDLGGSCDAYDTQTDTVVDWKVVGPTSLKKYRKDKNPGQQYRSQLHLYGLGWENAGRKPHTVSIVFLPSSGALADTYTWSEPYDDKVADQALARLDMLRLGLAVNASRGVTAQLEAIPAQPAHPCVFCPWFRFGSTDLATGCPGVDPDPRVPTSAVDLTGAVL